MIGTGLGIAGSLLSSQYNNNLAAENASMAYNRQRSLMALQQQYAVENWNREANYNSPYETMKRLREGGLNPNLFYGNGAQNLASPGISSPSSPGSPMAQVVPMSNPIAEAAGAAQALSLAKKAGSETIAQEIENQYLSKTLADRVAAVGKQNNWTDEQIAHLSQSISKMVGEMNVMNKDVELTDKKIKWFDRQVSAEIADLKASVQYKEAVAKMTDKQRELMEATFDDLKSITNWNAQFLENTVQLLDKYGDAQAIIGMISQVVGSVTDIASLFIPSKQVGNVIGNLKK